MKRGGATPAGAFRATLAKAHDAVTHVGFIGAACCLAVIVCSYCYEVVARYFFSAPTEWASSLVSKTRLRTPGLPSSVC